MSRLFLNTSRHSDSTTSLDRWFQHTSTLSGKNFLLTSNLNFPQSILRLHPLVLSVVAWKRRQTPTWLQPQGAVESDKGLQSFPRNKGTPKAGCSTAFPPALALVHGVTVPLRGKLPWSHQEHLVHRTPQGAPWPLPNREPQSPATIPFLCMASPASGVCPCER